ncbi:ferredoxin [Rhodospirillum rubrum]|uniref:4Fe-4S binding protein n=1 Tax=Rhodospirillum rubrum TaxID=1085 RepID=UPI00190898D9|nr:4Fe-4S binding protein [Rhodospirillum rubrum]MBK1664711.1 ferredoxin [Rhodospirillum rubrum]MBK1676533.1 ferredoxin [Rhodospirillum rubrum]
MALKIDTNACTSCGACEFECPNAAISMKGDVYVIKASQCTECDGDAPKCSAVCPTDACVPG